MTQASLHGAIAIDGPWLAEHPLPVTDTDTDKNSRGRVLVLGGCSLVPGGVRLTAEAAFRAGAGKVQVGTIEAAAMPLAMLMPEIGVFALPANVRGEIDAARADLDERIASADAVVVGPAMGCAESASALVGTLHAAARETALVLDAAALLALSDHAAPLAARSRPAILTPHQGEMAALLGCDADWVRSEPAEAAVRAARRFGAIVVLKGPQTVVADPAGPMLVYHGGNPGQATGGSGDVLAGIAGALLARGAPPLEGAAWAVWLHGEAGRACAEAIGPIGYLARELLVRIPAAMQDAQR